MDREERGLTPPPVVLKSRSANRARPVPTAAGALF
jgi:hypothetical protein